MTQDHKLVMMQMTLGRLCNCGNARPHGSQHTPPPSWNAGMNGLLGCAHQTDVMPCGCVFGMLQNFRILLEGLQTFVDMRQADIYLALQGGK